MTKRLLVLVGCALLMESFFSAVLTPLVPAYRRDFDLTDGATGILVASYAAGSLLFALPAGWFASRFNPRKAVILGLVGVGLSSVLFGFAGVAPLLDLSRVLLGAFGALLWAGGLSWAISSSAVANRGRVMGVVLSAAVAGELVGAPAGALANEIGTEAVFGAILILALILVALARTIPAAAEADGQTVGAAVQAVKAAGTRAWLVAMLAVLGPSIALGAILLILPLRFETLGRSSWLLAGAFLSMSLVEMLAGPVAGRISDLVGRTKPYLVGVAIMATCLIPIALATSLWVLAFLLVTYAAGSGFAFTTSMTRVTDLATEAGLNQGYSSAASAIGWAGGVLIGALVGGFLVGSIGYLGGVLTLATGLLVIGSVTYRNRPLRSTP